MSDLLNLMQSRKSVRSFDGAPLRAEDRARLEYIATVDAAVADSPEVLWITRMLLPGRRGRV